jgi:hypothetical protein
MPASFTTILLAAIAGCVTGAAWYCVLGRQWRRALGHTDAETNDAAGKKRLPVIAMIISFLALLVTAYLLAGIIFHLGAPSLRRGVISGALVWLGFTLPPLVVNYAFQRRKPMLTAIDSGHWLLVFALQGAIIGLRG